MTYGNGLSESRSFNLGYEPDLVTSGPLSLDYTMSAAGNVSSVIDGGSAVSYGFDALEGVVTNLRLPGQYDERLLASIGLQGPYYNWHRWYLPSAGRYLEPDPIAAGGGFNGDWGPDWFGCAGGNPLAWIDPEGLSKYDKLYGLPKRFWKWYHRDRDYGKRSGDVDVPDKKTADELYKEWNELGRPGPDKKGRRGDGGDDGGSGWDDILDVIIPMPPLILPDRWQEMMPDSIRCREDPCDPRCNFT